MPFCSNQLELFPWSLTHIFKNVEIAMRWNCMSKALRFLQLMAKHQGCPFFTIFLTMKTSSQNISITRVRSYRFLLNFTFNSGSGRVFSGSGIWPKYGSGFGKTRDILMGNGILQLPGLRDLSVCLACLLAFLLFCFGNKKGIRDSEHAKKLRDAGFS